MTVDDVCTETLNLKYNSDRVKTRRENEKQPNCNALRIFVTAGVTSDCWRVASPDSSATSWEAKELRGWVARHLVDIWIRSMLPKCKQSSWSPIRGHVLVSFWDQLSYFGQLVHPWSFFYKNRMWILGQRPYVSDLCRVYVRGSHKKPQRKIKGLFRSSSSLQWSMSDSWKRLLLASSTLFVWPWTRKSKMSFGKSSFGLERK